MFDKRKDSQASGGGQTNAPNRVAPRMPTGSQESATATTATIGPTIVINGKVTGEEDIVIAGTIEGRVDLPRNSVTIAAGGRAHADVNANIIEVQGEVQGDIYGVEKVLITKTGRMLGNIVSNRVILEDGANFKGSIDMEAEPALAEATATTRQSAASASSKTGTAGKAGSGSKAGNDQKAADGKRGASVALGAGRR